MRINFEKSHVNFSPETPEETAKLEALWRLLVDCVGFNKKLVPIGIYIPETGSEGASFYIEGLEQKDQKYVEVKLEKGGRAYCKTCNNLIDLKPGDIIPICCGKMMEIID